MNENRKKTVDKLIEIHGLQKSGFIGTVYSLWYLSFGYFTNYKKHLIYKEVLGYLVEIDNE